MQITSTLEQDGSAVLKLVTNSSQSDFVINGATKLAADLQTILNSPSNGAVRRMRTRIGLLAQPEPMRSKVGATQ